MEKRVKLKKGDMKPLGERESHWYISDDFFGEEGKEETCEFIPRKGMFLNHLQRLVRSVEEGSKD